MRSGPDRATNPIPLWARDDTRFWAKFSRVTGTFLIVFSTVSAIVHRVRSGIWSWHGLDGLLLGLALLMGRPEPKTGWRLRLRDPRFVLVMMLMVGVLVMTAVEFNEQIQRITAPH